MNEITIYSGMEGQKGMPHNGKRLREAIFSEGITQTEMSRRMGVSPSTLQSYYKSESLQMSVWWRASKALRYNFIAEMGMQIPIDFATPRESELQKEVKTLQKKIEKLKIELNVYKDIMKR